MHACYACMHIMHAYILCNHACYACMHIMHACMLCMHAYHACMLCMHVMHACILCMHTYNAHARAQAHEKTGEPQAKSSPDHRSPASGGAGGRFAHPICGLGLI